MQGTIRLNDFEMKYCRFGNGSKTFVILPGLSVAPVSPAEDLIAQIYSAFTVDYTVYLFDRRENAPEGYSTEQMADDTAAAMQFLGLSKTHVFGASQGGMIAMALALRHPVLVEKLVLGSTASRPNGMSARVIGGWIKLAEERNAAALNESILCGVYSEKTVRERGDAIRAAFGPISDDEFIQFITVAKPIITFNCYDILDQLTCSVLVLGSEGDQVLSGTASSEIADKLGCASFMYGPEYGHGVYDEAPDYTEKMLDFLKK